MTLRSRLGADPNELTMEDLFTKILRTRFGGGKASAEWGYNLVHALEAHKYDADCEIFLEVLRGNLNEDVYYDQMVMHKYIVQAM